MSNVRMLGLTTDLLYTTVVALDYRRGILEATGDRSDYGPKLTKIVNCIDAYQSEMAKVESWTDDQVLNTAKTMMQFGGGFARCIAEAYFNGDSHNRARVVAAFSEMFIKYGPGGAFYEEDARG